MLINVPIALRHTDPPVVSMIGIGHDFAILTGFAVQPPWWPHQMQGFFHRNGVSSAENNIFLICL